MRLITVLILLLYTTMVSAKVDTLINDIFLQHALIDSSDQATFEGIDLLIADGKTVEALEAYQQLMIDLLPEFTEKNIEANPSESDLHYCSSSVVGALLGKAKLIEAQGEDIENLEQALSCKELAVDALFHLRQNYYGAQLNFDKAISMKQEEWNAIDLAYDLYEKSNNPSYLLRCFRLVEKSKKASLMDALINPKTFQVANVEPERLREIAKQKEKVGRLYTDWAKGIASYNNEATDSVSTFERNYIRVRNTFYRKLSEFSKRYPNVYSLRYNESVVTVGEIQNRLERPEQVLLSYHFTDRYLYGFVITLNGLKAKRIKTPVDLNQKIIRFHQILRAKKEQENCSDYEALALNLYKTLIQPFEPLSSEVTIIPDGLIGYIPFNALFFEPATKPCAFDKSPFLLNKYQIGMHYSAEKFAKDAYANNKNTGVDLVTLSSGTTSYVSDLNKQFKGEEVKLGQTDDLTSPLLNAMMENSVVLFASDVSSYSGEERRQSTIKWYDREVGNVKIDPLVVLSDCDVVISKMPYGDHIPTLPRGLMYHGAGSILTTLWPLDEEVNGELLSCFFRKLKKGKGKMAALQKTNFQYLNSQKAIKDAAPSEWASYMLVGNADALTEENWYWLLLFTIPIAFGIFYWRKKKKEQIRKEREVTTTMEY